MLSDPFQIIPNHIRKIITAEDFLDDVKINGAIQLNNNENALGSPYIKWFNRYPQKISASVKDKLAFVKNISSTQLCITNGFNEALDLVVRLFGTPGKDTAIICTPGGNTYEKIFQLNDVECIDVSLNEEFQLDLIHLEQVVKPEAKMIVIGSPNAISGNSMLRDDIEMILNNFNGLVIIDETYINFSRQKSFISELSDYKNLIVIQSLDIAWGLANLQVAMIIASEEIIDYLNRIKSTPGICSLVENVITDALDNVGMVNDMINELVQMRVALKKVLEKFPFVVKVYSSDANFLLVKFEDADSLYQHLLNHKIVVMDAGKFPYCNQCLRITIGTEEENTKLIEALVDYYDKVYQH